MSLIYNAQWLTLSKALDKSSAHTLSTSSNPESNMADVFPVFGFYTPYWIPDVGLHLALLGVRPLGLHRPPPKI